MIYIGPTLLSGIGQSLYKYSKLMGGNYHEINHYYPRGQDAFIFALPIKHWFDEIPNIKKNCRNVICMTVCETETVHEEYGKLFEMFDTIAVPSQFCIDVFSKQFPNGPKFKLIRHCVPIPEMIYPLKNDFKIPSDKYVFYHIGNIIDPRKNINMLIRAFLKCDFKDAFLFLKATCNQEVGMNYPNIRVVNGLMNQNEIENIHQMCDCYVSCSFSEGVGMGAVEAACKDNPVIISEFGGAKEYINTPYVIKCGQKEIENDDFLFKKGMKWGDPNEEQLITFMKDAYNKKMKYMDGSHTRHVTSKKEILNQIITFFD